MDDVELVLVLISLFIAAAVFASGFVAGFAVRSYILVRQRRQLQEASYLPLQIPSPFLAPGTTALLTDQPDPAVLPQTPSPSLALSTTALVTEQPDPPVLPPSPFLAPGTTALVTERPNPPALPQTPSPSLTPGGTALLTDQPDPSVLPQTPSPSLAPGGTAPFADQLNPKMGKYFFAIGSVLTAILIALAYKLGSPSDDPYSGSSKTGLVSNNPSANVGSRAPVSDSTVTSSGDGSIDLRDGGETTGQTSHPQSESSVEGNKVIHSEAMVPLPRRRPSHAPAARPNERKPVKRPAKAFSPFEAFEIVPPSN